MNNTQVAQTWRNQTKSEGHSKNMFFEHDAIYSYGYHFPMAMLTNSLHNGACIVLQNADGYSNTTARHLCHMRSACIGDAIVTMPTGILKMALQYNVNWEEVKEKTRAYLESEIVKAEEKKSRARVRKDIHEARIEDLKKQLETLAQLQV